MARPGHWVIISAIFLVTVPLLAQQGQDERVKQLEQKVDELMRQTTALRQEIDQLKAAQPAAKLVVIPAANHVYRATTTDDRIAQMKLYVDPTLPIVPELTPAIAEWIKSLK